MRAPNEAKYRRNINWVPREAEILLFPNRRLMTLIDGFALP